MVIISAVNIEILLICSESYAVLLVRPKNHLAACKMVKKNIFQNWHECHRIDEIKVNFLFGNNCKPLVALVPVDRAPQIQDMV